jgi:hypothetical protein
MMTINSRNEGMIMERAILSVDGNCGCALLGENLQEGEAEFVKVERRPDEYLHEAQVRACWAAFKNLKKRLGKEFSYAWQTRRPGSAGA